MRVSLRTLPAAAVVGAALVAASVSPACAAEKVDPDVDLLLAANGSVGYGAVPGERGRRDSFYVTPTVSTLGLGIELSRSVGENLALRIGAAGFDYTYEDTVSDVDYELDLRLRSLGAHVDWHPGGSGAFLTGGVLYNGNQVGAFGEAAGDTIEIGDVVFPSEQVGTLTGSVDFEQQFAPVLGAGWNTAFAGNRLGLHLMAGVVFQGEPQVTLAADGEIADEPLFQEELEKERADLEDDLAILRFYPVASIGLTLRF